ncbi:MAG: DUF4962 domain-containing protein, partial [Armatimonadota bacterium]
MYRQALAVALLFISTSVHAAPLDAVWTREKPGDGGWVSDDARFAPDAEGVVTVNRGAPHHSRLSTTVEADLGATPWLELRAHASNAQWRLTGSFDGGPELVIADRQTVGRSMRDIAELFGEGAGELALHMHIWGWGNGSGHYVRFTPSLVAEGAHSDAAELLGEMAREHAGCASRADELRLSVPGHPRLRFSDENREHWRELVAEHPQYGAPLVDVIAAIDEHRAEEPFVFDAESARTKRPAFGEHLLAIRPAAAPELRPGEGRDPFPGMSTESAWRLLYWHNFSHWLIGAALSDGAAFVEQAKRWALGLVRWRFWLEADYIYFDFGTAYPLQCLSMAYDIAYDGMTEAERAEVRHAIATLAHGLYLNTISGHGSIYNDLRGNHTAVTMDGLGMAGCALLGEDERAPLWVALAERFMLDTFEEHTSGAWVESPSYGTYGVSEWL